MKSVKKTCKRGVTIQLTNGAVLTGDRVFLEKNFYRVFIDKSNFASNTEIPKDKVLYIRHWWIK